MTPFHVFGIQSRLGIAHPSIGQTQKTLGVEKGPEVLLESLPEWLLESAEVDCITLPEPESLPEDQILPNIGLFSQQIKDTLLQYWKPGQTPIFIGGDHSISLATMAAVQKRFADKYVAVIQFDSHADVHLPETSPSNNFHGMWARAAQQEFPVPEIDAVVAPKYAPSRWLSLGNLVVEDAEVKYLEQERVATIATADLQANLEAQTQRIIDHIRVADHIHISFDIDVFAAVNVPGTGTPNLKGMAPTEVWPLIHAIRTAQQTTGASISLDLVEFNPQKDLQGKTLALSLEVLRRFFN